MKDESDDPFEDFEDEETSGQSVPHLFQVPIPEQFFEDETEEPFKKCIMCQKSLTGDVEYMVEKAIRRYPDLETEEVQFELAVCIDCSSKMRNQLSKESLQNIQQYFQQQMTSGQPPERVFDFDSGTILNWQENCLFKNISRAEMTEYHMYGHFVGDKMTFGMFPYILSGKAIEEMQELLSKETKDEMDDFIDTYFGLPPELKDIFKDNPILAL